MSTKDFSEIMAAALTAEQKVQAVSAVSAGATAKQAIEMVGGQSTAAAKPANGKAKDSAAAVLSASDDALLAWIYRAIPYYRTKAAEHNPKFASKGIHTVLSGFNAAFRAKFNADPVQVTKMYVAAGKLQSRPSKAGAMIFLPGEKPPETKRNVDVTADLAAIG